MTLISDENEGWKDLARSKASKRLNLTDHLRSSSVILPSAEEAVDFLGFSFFNFFSGGRDRDLAGLDQSTGPMTETKDGSTRDSASFTALSVSSFFASASPSLIYMKGWLTEPFVPGLRRCNEHNQKSPSFLHTCPCLYFYPYSGHKTDDRRNWP